MASPQSTTSISLLLHRAHSAIARARNLSTRLQNPEALLETDSSGASRPQDAPQQDHHSHAACLSSTQQQQQQQQQQEGVPNQHDGDDAPEHTGEASTAAEPSNRSAAESPPASSTLPAAAEPEPAASIAQRLGLLQNQQQDTLRQLMHLRMEQLRLRQQQLKALQCMLQAEAAELGDRPPQQLAAQQAMRLLLVSLHDLRALHATVLLDGNTAAAAAALALSNADTRAEEVSRIVRELLQVLREGRQRTADGPAEELAGATEQELRELPMHLCTEDSVLCGQSCMICLSPFQAHDALRCLQCAHHCHAACLDEWLRIKASCPLCKLSMRAGLSAGS